MSLIIDLVLLVILIICAWSGYKKGILMGLGGILCIIVSIYGGNLLANLFSYDVVPALKPFVSAFAESYLTAEDTTVLEQMGWDGYDYSVEDLLQQNPARKIEFSSIFFESLGIDAASADRMAERSVTYASESGVTIMNAIVHILSESISYVVCFLLAFTLILILLTMLGNLPNLSYKIPNLDLVNDIGGAVLGLVTGFLFCILIVWALKFLGVLFESGTLSSARLAGWLLRKNFLLNYLNI